MYRTHFAADNIGLAKELAHAGDLDGAVVKAHAGVAMMETLAEANPTNSTLQEYLAEAYNQLAPVFEKHGDSEEALADIAKATRIFDELAARNPADMLARDNAALAEADFGKILLRAGDTRQAIPHLQKAAEELAAGPHENLYERTGLADAEFRWARRITIPRCGGGVSGRSGKSYSRRARGF